METERQKVNEAQAKLNSVEAAKSQLGTNLDIHFFCNKKEQEVASLKTSAKSGEEEGKLIAQIQVKIAALTSEIERLKSENEKLRDPDNSDIGMELKTAKAEIVALKSANAALEADMDQLFDENDKLRDPDNSDIGIELKASKAENQKLVDEIAKLKDIIKTKESEKPKDNSDQIGTFVFYLYANLLATLERELRASQRSAEKARTKAEELEETVTKMQVFHLFVVFVM